MLFSFSFPRTIPMKYFLVTIVCWCGWKMCEILCDQCLNVTVFFLSFDVQVEPATSDRQKLPNSPVDLWLLPRDVRYQCGFIILLKKVKHSFVCSFKKQKVNSEMAAFFFNVWEGGLPGGARNGRVMNKSLCGEKQLIYSLITSTDVFYVFFVC